MALEVITEYAMLYPRTSVLVFAAIISLFISLVNFFVLDKDKMRISKAKQKELQKKMKEHQKVGETDKILELQKEMMTHASDSIKQSFKPMLITMIPVLIFFAFIKNVYVGTEIASSWIWWYLAGAIVSSILFRKVFRLP